MITINYEYYVDLEIAKLLEKAGFNWEEHYPRNFCYVNDNPELFDKSILKNYIEKDDVIYLAPTIDVAQKWLREVKGYIILVNYNEFLKTFYYSICYIKNTNRYIDDRDDCRNTSFEEAQKAGIKKALKLLLEKGE